jgi:adenylyl-sulfate kinase
LNLPRNWEGSSIAMPATSPVTITLPDLALDPVQTRDVELALLGLLPAGHLLGDAVCARTTSAALPVEGVTVRVAASPELADAITDAGGALLRDQEFTPLARMVHAVPVGALPGPPSVVLGGRLQPERTRESGDARCLALSRADLVPHQERRTLVLLERPPVEADEHRLRTALHAGADAGYVVVADSPGGDVPFPVLMSTARAWVAAEGLGNRVHLRSAPLAWRDQLSNNHLTESLARAIGASTVLHLASSDGSEGAGQWREVRLALEAGNGSPLTRVSPPVGRQLVQWRPPRHERGLVLMFSGLSGSGKSTLARDVTEWVRSRTDRTVTLLDGDVVRTMLSSGLGFDRTSRDLNVRRIGYVAAEVARHGGIAICAPIAPYSATRSAVREMAQEAGDFLLVHVATPLAECERRDLKGLYARARAGLLPEFTGVSDPYEEPDDADLRVDTSLLDRAEALAVVTRHLIDGGWLSGTPS